MSTNNNRYGKEIRPIWISEEAATKTIRNLSGDKLQRLISNDLSSCNAITLTNRNITQIDDLKHMNTNLRRLDLSNNQITRLNGFVSMASSDSSNQLSLLNISMNDIKGDSGLEDLRYLPELRTLNISKNQNIKSIRTHVIKPLTAKLQALIANDCGLINASFIRLLPNLNTLVLSDNALDSFPMKEYGIYPNLVKLSLGRNKLTIFPDLSTCLHLNELRINHNMIQSIPTTFIQQQKRHLKTFDISNNLLSSWDDVQVLTGLEGLTNLSLHGNPFCLKPYLAAANVELKEDISAGSILDPVEKEYRRNVLIIFQRLVGKLQKLFVQLIILDNKRVKTKWTQGGSQKMNHNVEMDHHHDDDGSVGGVGEYDHNLAEEVKEDGKYVEDKVMVSNGESSREVKEEEKKMKKKSKNKITEVVLDDVEPDQVILTKKLKKNKNKRTSESVVDTMDNTNDENMILSSSSKKMKKRKGTVKG